MFADPLSGSIASSEGLCFVSERQQEGPRDDSTGNDNTSVHVVPRAACGTGADGMLRWDGAEGRVDEVEAVLLWTWDCE